MESLFLRVAPQSILLLYMGKLLISGANLPDAMIIAVLCGLSGLSSYLSDEKYKKQIQKQFEELDKKDKELQELIEIQKNKIEEVKTYASGIKLGTQLRVK